MGEEDHDLIIKILDRLLAVSETAIKRVPPEIRADLDEVAKLLKRLKGNT